MKKHLGILALLLCLPVCLSAQLYSFEGSALPSEFAGCTGVSISSERYKLGSKSLKWEWNEEDVLSPAELTGLASASTASNGGIYCWIYNQTASQQQINFLFTDTQNRQNRLPVKLNFSGWRCIWATFRGDMGHNGSTIRKMQIEAPAFGSGTLYIDHLEFPTNVSWERMSNDQYVVTMNSGIENFLTIRNAVPTTFATTPNAAQRQGMATIAQRLEDWFFPSEAYSSNDYVNKRTLAFNTFVTRGRNRLATLSLNRGADGIVTGSGLYPQFTSRANDGTTVLRFRDINEQYLIQLAYDARKNNNTSSLNGMLDIYDWMHDQGWTNGSTLGTLRFEKLRSAGYFYSLFLLRNQLGKERLNRELETLQWMSLIGNSYLPNKDLGDTADNIRVLHIAQLIYALSQTDEKAQLAHLQQFVGGLSNAYAQTSGYLGTFKPDFSGYHHRGAYYSSYYPQALYTACFIYYLLHDTPFALSDEIYQSLKGALLMFRFVAANYDVPAATSGRFPTGNTIMERILPAFSYLVLSKEDGDSELTAAFKRLWKPDEEPLATMISRAVTDITYQLTIGEVEAMVRTVAQPTPAEEAVEGAVYQPFAGMLTVKRPQWAMSIKGKSRYIWDYEASSSENLYGRYLSNGHIEWTNLKTGQKSFNASHTHWDWSRLPGTTAIHLSASELTNTGNARYFTSDSFLGGVVLNDTTSLFSVALSDRTFNTSFKSKKTVFVIGNTLYCIDSNVTNTDANRQTETTLFQNLLQATDKVLVNGTPVSTNQNNLTQPTIIDNYGNLYRIFSTNPVSIAFGNSLATAYINYGKAPNAALSMHGMVIGGGDDAVLSGIEVKKSDAGAHYIYEPQSKTTALAIYTAANNLDCGLVKRVNAPALVLIREGDDVELVFSDPDMRQGTSTNSDNLSDAVVATPGASFNFEMELYGVFHKTAGDEAVLVQQNDGTTTLKAAVKEGCSYRLKLNKNSVSIQEQPAQPAFSYMQEGENYTIRSNQAETFRCTLTDVHGRIFLSEDAIYRQHTFSLHALPAGIYIFRAEDTKQSIAWKLYHQKQ